MKVADHVWFMNGNTFFEFDDHFTMVEANRTDAALQAILKVINGTRARQARHTGRFRRTITSTTAWGFAPLSLKG